MFNLLQPYLPHHLISKLVSILCYCKWKWFKNWSIKRFIKRYGVNLEEAENPKIADYIHLNAFFTRKIQQNLRPIVYGNQNVICPVDGSISQFGNLQDETLLQAKGFDYKLASLVANQEKLIQHFKNGSFMTIYLAPHDYHRIHMPLSGQLESMTYVPGRLFSVNTRSAASIPHLFARNERVINVFQTVLGPVAIILVGAMIVGSMETVWAGCVKPPGRKAQYLEYPAQGPEVIQLEQGAEMGRFNFGSTVILLFGPNTVTWHDKCAINATMHFGELLANSALES